MCSYSFYKKPKRMHSIRKNYVDIKKNFFKLKSPDIHSIPGSLFFAKSERKKKKKKNLKISA